METALAYQAHVTAHEELITPDRAAELLSRNTRNRPISKPYVRELRRELEEGRWKPTHQGVAITRSGNLADGQHRLTAIVESGISAPMLVAEGVADDAFDAIDQIRKRTGGQILAMAGVSRDAPRMVAIARAVLAVVHGNTKVSNTAAAEYVVAHQEAIERFLPVARQFTPAVAAAFAWCSTLGWPEVHQAAERLVSNGPWEEPQETDPMRALTNRSREFARLGAGQSGIKARFDIALNCLQAVHEGRGLRVARSYRPDYAALERDSLTPASSALVGRGLRSLSELHAETVAAQEEHDSSFSVPPEAMVESVVEMTDEHAEALERSLAPTRKRKSFMSPADLMAATGRTDK